MKTLGLIIAKKNSRRLPGKNAMPFLGEPLICRTARIARESGVLDRILLSTDCLEMGNLGQSSHLEFQGLRPDDLARAETDPVDVALYELDLLAETGWKPDLIVLLQPTSPLRDKDDIKAAVDMMSDPEVPGVLSVCALKPNLSWLRTISEETLQPLPAIEGIEDSEDRIVYPNGAVYVVREKIFREARNFTPSGSRGYLMPQWRSVDVDTLEDFEMAERFAKGIQEAESKMHLPNS